MGAAGVTVSRVVRVALVQTVLLFGLLAVLLWGADAAMASVPVLQPRHHHHCIVFGGAHPRRVCVSTPGGIRK